MDPAYRLHSLFNNPGFWRGALAVRNADLEAAAEAPSGVGSWLQEAAIRARTLLEAARTEVDVTSLPEFERWLGPRAVFHTVPEPEPDYPEDLTLEGLRR
jgi:hypothetical protein